MTKKQPNESAGTSTVNDHRPISEIYLSAGEALSLPDSLSDPPASGGKHLRGTKFLDFKIRIKEDPKDIVTRSVTGPTTTNFFDRVCLYVFFASFAENLVSLGIALTSNAENFATIDEISVSSNNPFALKATLERSNLEQCTFRIASSTKFSKDGHKVRRASDNSQAKNIKLAWIHENDTKGRVQLLERFFLAPINLRFEAKI